MNHWIAQSKYGLLTITLFTTFTLVAALVGIAYQFAFLLDAIGAIQQDWATLRPNRF